MKEIGEKEGPFCRAYKRSDIEREKSQKRKERERERERGKNLYSIKRKWGFRYIVPVKFL